MTQATPPILSHALAAACLAFLAAAPCAAAPPVPVPVPASFGVTPTHATQSVVYGESAGEAPNTVDRTAFEKVCAMRHSLDPTTPTPVFEAGFDRANATQSVRFDAPRARADYVTITGYTCDPASGGAAKDACGCTFRTHVSRFVHIRKFGSNGTEFIDADLVRGTLRRRLQRGAPADGASSAMDAMALGAVVGKDIVAGVACIVHRQDVGAGRLERCIADTSDATPVELRGQQLAHAHFLLRDGRALRQEWSRTRRIEQDAQVDTGVFDAPSGLRDSSSASTKDTP